jgi:hypothetical protein
MSKLELESYKQMAPAAMRDWLISSFVITSCVATTIGVIVTNNFDRSFDIDAGSTPSLVSSVI